MGRKIHINWNYNAFSLIANNVYLHYFVLKSMLKCTWVVYRGQTGNTRRLLWHMHTISVANIWHEAKWLVNHKAICWISNHTEASVSQAPAPCVVLRFRPAASAVLIQCCCLSDTRYQNDRNDRTHSNPDPLSSLLSYVLNTISSAVRLFVKRSSVASG